MDIINIIKKPFEKDDLQILIKKSLEINNINSSSDIKPCESHESRSKVDNIKPKCEEQKKPATNINNASKPNNDKDDYIQSFIDKYDKFNFNNS
jgi:hypothetical protein